MIGDPPLGGDACVVHRLRKFPAATKQEKVEQAVEQWSPWGSLSPSWASSDITDYQFVISGVGWSIHSVGLRRTWLAEKAIWLH
jgi:hypothetical protein